MNGGSVMRPVLSACLLLGCLAACESIETATPPQTTADEIDDVGLLVDGPTREVEFDCSDGRQVMVSAFVGGVIVRVDGQTYQMPQVSVPDATGIYHQLDNIGWYEDTNWDGHLVMIGAGQTLLTAPDVFCDRIGPMWWDLDQPAG
jgi:hypothetical protein